MKKSVIAATDAYLVLLVFLVCVVVGRVLSVPVADLPLFAVGCVFSMGFAFSWLTLRRDGLPQQFKSSFRPSWPRVFVKWFGLASGFGFVALCYWLFPEYHGSFYDRFYQVVKWFVPAWLLLSVPYLYWFDGVSSDPFDSLFSFGGSVLGVIPFDSKAVGQSLLSWAVKGFFLPLMFIYFVDGLVRFVHADFGLLGTLPGLFQFCLNSLYLVDVAIAVLGYVLSLRVLGSHVRSTDATAFGWLSALVCYQPFWSLIGGQFLSYGAGVSWLTWLSDYPVIRAAWAVSILSLIVVYVWATVMFSARFSNLTHRGIVTNGPYAYLKHPAYVTKNLSWWLVSVPFAASLSTSEVIRHCLLLALLNLVYAARAYTEERHLMRDPDYVQYAAWIGRYGIFARIKRAIANLVQSGSYNNNSIIVKTYGMELASQGTCHPVLIVSDYRHP